MKLYITVALPVVTSLFWAIVLLRNYHKDNAKFSLGIFMALTTLLYACHALFFLNNNLLYLKVDSLYLLASLSVYPTYYIYVRLLTIDEKLHVGHLKHFIIPVILSVILSILHIAAPLEQEQHYFQNTLLANNVHSIFSEGSSAWLSRVFYISRLIFAFQVFIYLAQGYKIASKHNKRLKHYYSNLENRQLVWIKLLSIIFWTASTASTVFNIIGRGQFVQNSDSLIIPSIIFSSIIFTVGLQGSKQKISIIKHACKNISTQQTSNIEKNKKDLAILIRKYNVYLEPDITLQQVSNLINARQEDIKRLISQEYGEDFNSFINRHRTGHARQLIKSGSNKSFNAYKIAKESGFSSKTSFIHAFKTHEGVSLKKYVKQISANV
jgi:AraC-like DNA-binding protein